MDRQLSLFVFVVAIFTAAEASYDKAQLYKTVMNDYNQQNGREIEPVGYGGGNTTVTVGLSVKCAAPVDGFVYVEAWLFMSWTDSRLAWEPSNFDGIDIMRVPDAQIWKPDIMLYNGVKTDLTSVNAVVYPNGKVIWVPPVNYLIRCAHGDDGVIHCSLKFGSWSYDGFVLDVDQRENEPLDLNDYGVCPYVIQSHRVTRQVMYYVCCPEPFPSVNFNFKLASR